MSSDHPSTDLASLTVQPLTADRWSDVERLFGDCGACGGCWCMYWRKLRVDYEAGLGDENRETFRRMVHGGPPRGVLAYVDDEPVGWCAVAPRDELARLTQSFLLQPVDDQPVWSVTCFFVLSDRRRAGISLALLRGAVALAREQGARIVEGYPVEPRHSRMPPAFAWTGFVSTFERAGFTECARRSESRPMMRFTIDA